MFLALMLSLLFRFGFSNDVPASFVFGDSLVDVGNNNYIVSLAKANHEPFGIDFGMPTGRFSNGKTVVDVISESFIFLYFFVQMLVSIITYFSLSRSETGSCLFSSLLGSLYYWINSAKGC